MTVAPARSTRPDLTASLEQLEHAKRARVAEVNAIQQVLEFLRDQLLMTASRPGVPMSAGLWPATEEWLARLDASRREPHPKVIIATLCQLLGESHSPSHAA